MSEGAQATESNPQQIFLMYHIYILECRDKTLYVGLAGDVQKRFKKHISGEAAQYTKSRRPLKLIYQESQLDYFTALKRENQIKRWSRAKKLALAKRDPNLLKKL